MFDNLLDSLNFIIQQTQNNAPVLAQLMAVLWGVFIINKLFLHNALLNLGIRPRRLSGLIGIFATPFLHAHFNHLFYNSIPLLVFSNFILIHGILFFIEVTLLITIISGLLTWALAKPGIHIGASGVITGYWGLLVMDIYQQGSILAILLGGFCLYFFAGIILGIFPGERGVSWQGHLFGLIAGILTSYLLTINIAAA